MYKLNCPEKITGAYLRLNGFFLLPQFTIFDGEQHSHIDFLALKPPAGRELCLDGELPKDKKLFKSISKLISDDAEKSLLGAIVEVKGGNEIEYPEGNAIKYAQHFIGDATPICSICFSKKVNDIEINNGLLIISLKYSLSWCIGRFEWMNENKRKLTKSGSWTWSEDFLSDLLYLHKIALEQ